MVKKKMVVINKTVSMKITRIFVAILVLLNILFSLFLLKLYYVSLALHQKSLMIIRNFVGHYDLFAQEVAKLENSILLNSNETLNKLYSLNLPKIVLAVDERLHEAVNDTASGLMYTLFNRFSMEHPLAQKQNDDPDLWVNELYQNDILIFLRRYLSPLQDSTWSTQIEAAFNSAQHVFVKKLVPETKLTKKGKILAKREVISKELNPEYIPFDVSEYADDFQEFVDKIVVQAYVGTNKPVLYKFPEFSGWTKNAATLYTYERQNGPDKWHEAPYDIYELYRQELEKLLNDGFAVVLNEAHVNLSLDAVEKFRQFLHKEVSSEFSRWNFEISNIDNRALPVVRTTNFEDQWTAHELTTSRIKYFMKDHVERNENVESIYSYLQYINSLVESFEDIFEKLEQGNLFTFSDDWYDYLASVLNLDYLTLALGIIFLSGMAYLFELDKTYAVLREYTRRLYYIEKLLGKAGMGEVYSMRKGVRRRNPYYLGDWSANLKSALNMFQKSAISLKKWWKEDRAEVKEDFEQVVKEFDKREKELDLDFEYELQKQKILDAKARKKDVGKTSKNK
jgi:hypothetical protein